MKKLLFTLFLSLLTHTMSAQIQRKFLGCTLGVSTPAQVKANMAQKGYRPSDTSNKGCYIYDNISSFSNNSESFPGIPSTKIFASPSGAHSNSPSTHFTVI